MKEREAWIDIVKGIACLLVLLGHLFQGIIKSGIMVESGIHLWFDHTIYLFHVALFFICSGYLYQTWSEVRTWKSWKENVIKKLLVLGVPYITFSTITYLIKLIFERSVNQRIGTGLAKILLQNPLSPYWYLYTLFLLFVVTPTFRNKREITIAMGVAVVLLVLRNEEWMVTYYLIRNIVTREIWFLAGMWLFFRKGMKRFDKRLFLFSLLFLPLSAITWRMEFPARAAIVVNFLMGLMGCLLVLQISFGIAGKIPEGLLAFSRKYTLPIFLMYTIFAAGIRIILIKGGIFWLSAHMIAGIAASILLPAAVGRIAARRRFLYFFIDPGWLFRKVV